MTMEDVTKLDLSTNKLVIYHKNCADGITAAWVVNTVYPNAMFHPMSYGDKFPVELVNDTIDVIFVDFSLKREELLDIVDYAKSLLVLDHHKTHEAELNGLDFGKFDMNESGATLAWKHYYPTADMPVLLRYIKDRDLWHNKLPSTEEITAYIQNRDYSIEEMMALHYDFEINGLSKAIQMGSELLKYKRKLVDQICSKARIIEINNYAVPYVETSILQSEVGHELCQRYPEAAFSASSYNEAGLERFSLRSVGTFDVSAIAAHFDGGGHRNAAGFEFYVDNGRFI